jgi:hypothetical protein
MTDLNLVTQAGVSGLEAEVQTLAARVANTMSTEIPSMRAKMDEAIANAETQFRWLLGRHQDVLDHTGIDIEVAPAGPANPDALPAGYRDSNGELVGVYIFEFIFDTNTLYVPASTSSSGNV